MLGNISQTEAGPTTTRMKRILKPFRLKYVCIYGMRIILIFSFCSSAYGFLSDTIERPMCKDLTVTQHFLSDIIEHLLTAIYEENVPSVNPSVSNNNNNNLYAIRQQKQKLNITFQTKIYLIFRYNI